jgi:hypothetical protein
VCLPRIFESDIADFEYESITRNDRPCPQLNWAGMFAISGTASAPLGFPQECRLMVTRDLRPCPELAPGHVCEDRVFIVKMITGPIRPSAKQKARGMLVNTGGIISTDNPHPSGPRAKGAWGMFVGAGYVPMTGTRPHKTVNRDNPHPSGPQAKPESGACFGEGKPPKGRSA